jgi:hypothetical protein
VVSALVVPLVLLLRRQSQVAPPTFA